MNKSRLMMSVKLTIALLMLGGSITAQAATITYTTNWSTSYGFSSGNNGPTFNDPLNASANRSISQFDPALGILQDITIDLSRMTLTSRASANFRDDDLLSTVAGVQSLQGMLINVVMPGYTISRPAPGRISTCSDTGVFSSSSCSTNLGITTSGISNSTGTLGPLSAYIGTGNVNILINQLASLFTDETNGDDGYVNSRSGGVSTAGFIDVTYNYTVVPVPAAVWLFGSGLLGLVGIARRKKAA